MHTIYDVFRQFKRPKMDTQNAQKYGKMANPVKNSRILSKSGIVRCYY
jgi:hypothetical protein